MNESTVQLIHGECFAEMAKLPDALIDLILCDLPYGTTASKCDTCIDFDKLWLQYLRLCKGQIILTAAQPFTSALVMSNPRLFRYELNWSKGKGSILCWPIN